MFHLQLPGCRIFTTRAQPPQRQCNEGAGDEAERELQVLKWKLTVADYSPAEVFSSSSAVLIGIQ